jgi:hypothetical protein
MTALDLRELLDRLQACPAEARCIALLTKRGPFPTGRCS